MILSFIHSRIRSFRNAFAGWWFVVRTQRNAWIHAVASVLVFLVSVWLQLNRLEWALIIVAVAMVWTAEFFNTALEVVVDLATRDQHPLAKVSKDVGAAAVLIASLNAAMIGLIVLGPPLVEKLKSLFIA